MATALEVFELALALAAHERIADKTGRAGWWPTEAARLLAEPDGYRMPPNIWRAPIVFAEWCWPRMTLTKLRRWLGLNEGQRADGFFRYPYPTIQYLFGFAWLVPANDDPGFRRATPEEEDAGY